MGEKLYHQETFIELAVGNFEDSIFNKVYGLQRYIDNYYNYIDFIYKPEIETDQNIKEIIKFSILEGENIIRYKGIAFAIEMDNLLMQKYNILKENILRRRSRYKYKISSNIKLYMKETSEDFNWDYIKYNIRTCKNIEFENLTNFDKFLRDKIASYNKKKFEVMDKEYSADEIIQLFDMVFNKLFNMMNQYKKIVENSDSIYTTSVTIRKIITLFVLILTTVKTIETIRIDIDENKEDE